MLIKQDDKALSEINVTPFIDVMLVLLIIFMAVVPIITASIKVELPRASEQIPPDQKKLVILTIDKQNAITINDTGAHLANLAEVLDAKTGRNFDEPIYFYVDKSVSYENLISVINQVKAIGYDKIALSSEVKR